VVADFTDRTMPKLPNSYNRFLEIFTLNSWPTAPRITETTDIRVAQSSKLITFYGRGFDATLADVRVSLTNPNSTGERVGCPVVEIVPHVKITCSANLKRLLEIREEVRDSSREIEVFVESYGASTAAKVGTIVESTLFLCLLKNIGY